MLDDTTMAVPALAVPALALPVDGLGKVVRLAARSAIEAAVETELTLALGRAAWERAVGATGYRHGTVPRTLVTSAGPVALTVPRGRLQQPDGATQEWRSTVLPRYARRTAALDATLARLYLSGASTRDLRRAIAPLFGSSALSKSAVSRVVTRLQGDYQTWQRRSLAAEPIAYLYLDVYLVEDLRTLGPVVLALRVVGGEQTAAWQRRLDDLTTRGLARPALVISDGSPGAAAALEATWPGLAHQRCLVHKLRNLIACVPRSLRAAVARDFRTIPTATSAAAVAAAVARFRQVWATQWSAVVVSLDEAGVGLTAFTAFPPGSGAACARRTRSSESSASSDAAPRPRARFRPRRRCSPCCGARWRRAAFACASCTATKRWRSRRGSRPPNREHRPDHPNEFLQLAGHNPPL